MTHLLGVECRWHRDRSSSTYHPQSCRGANQSSMSCTHLGAEAGECPLGSTPALPGKQTLYTSPPSRVNPMHKYLQHPGTALLQSLLLFGQSSVLRTGFCTAPLQVCKLSAQNLTGTKPNRMSSLLCEGISKETQTTINRII